MEPPFQEAAWHCGEGSSQSQYPPHPLHFHLYDPGQDLSCFSLQNGGNGITQPFSCAASYVKQCTPNTRHFA